MYLSGPITCNQTNNSSAVQLFSKGVPWGCMEEEAGSSSAAAVDSLCEEGTQQLIIVVYTIVILQR